MAHPAKSPSAKPIRPSITKSAQWEGKQLLRRGERVTSHKLQPFVISEIAKQSCSQGTRQILLSDLAIELNVDPSRLQPLIDHGYLRPTSPVAVILPPPAALEWLRAMFQPLPLRPWLPTDMVAEVTNQTPSEIRTLCLNYNIPLIADPAFGELMSIASFHRVLKQLHLFRKPFRSDRQMILRVLINAIPEKESLERNIKELPYSARLEKAITRIARLPEPERTFRATALLDAYKEAQTVTEAFARYKGLRGAAELRQMSRLEKIVDKSVGA